VYVVTRVETDEYHMQMIALNTKVAEVKVDLIIAVEKCVVLTSTWRADRYTKLLRPIEKRKKKKKKKRILDKDCHESTRWVIGARERVRPAST
jgi:hypothetical protein